MTRPLTRGTPVIIDTCDAPEAKMVAVLMRYDDRKGYWLARYLSDATRMRVCWNDRPTPLSDFGIRLEVNAHGNQYRCVKTGAPSKATYEDGVARQWQDYHGVIWCTARPLAMKLLKLDEVTA